MKMLRLLKKNFAQKVNEDKVKFDDITTRTLTISDLQEMKQKREEEIFEKPEKMILIRKIFLKKRLTGFFLENDKFFKSNLF